MRAGQHEEKPGDEPARHAPRAPARIGGKLHRLGPRQEHAERQRAEELALAQPAAPRHQLVVHDGDLRRRPAETQQADARKAAEQIGEGGRVHAPLVPRIRQPGKRNCAFAIGPFMPSSSGLTRGSPGVARGSRRAPPRGDDGDTGDDGRGVEPHRAIAVGDARDRHQVGGGAQVAHVLAALPYLAHRLIGRCASCRRGPSAPAPARPHRAGISA